jgi:hypothetical protein
LVDPHVEEVRSPYELAAREITRCRLGAGMYASKVLLQPSCLRQWWRLLSPCYRKALRVSVAPATPVIGGGVQIHVANFGSKGSFALLPQVA